MAIVELKADTAPFLRQLDELASLKREAGDIPESILEELRGLIDEIGSELALSSHVSAVGAGEQIVEISFREGGKFDRVTAALRALRDGREFGHGGLRV